MKSIKKIILSAALACACSCGLAGAAYAVDSSISYEGGAEAFVFLPGSSYSSSDLFDGLKNAMPGDSLSQQIIIKDNGSDDVTVKIYLRAVAHDEQANPLQAGVAATETVASMSDFLAQLNLKIYNGSELISEGPASELAGLQDNVLLGSYEKGQQSTLTAVLEVPLSLGNDYAYRVGEIDWVFVAEEIPHPTPITGDRGFIYVIAAGAVVLAAGAALAVLALKRRKEQKEAEL